MQDISRKYNLFSEVQTFYVLQALQIALYVADPYRRIEAKLIADSADIQRSHTVNFANAMFDYLLLACFGEARHGDQECTHYLLPLDSGESRSAAQYLALEYQPFDNLPLLVNLFNRDWRRGYGGSSWARIAQAAAYYGNWPDVVFIDHCINLAHNNGPCFDKEVIFYWTVSKSAFLNFLDAKFKLPIEGWGQVIVPPAVQRLLQRASLLGFVQQVEVLTLKQASEGDAGDSGYYCKSLVNGYQPVIWGDKKLHGLVKSPDRDNDKDYDEDYSEDREEDYKEEDSDETNKAEEIIYPAASKKGRSGED